MPFDLPYGASLSTAGVDGRPKFVHAWTFSRAGALSEALLGLTMGADGVDPSANAFASHNLLSLYPTYDRRQVIDLLARYGRFIARLGQFKDIAILFSARQAWGNADRLHLGRVRSLYHDLLRSRRSPHILFDEDMKVEALEGYRALFLLGLTVPLSPEARAAIRGFEDSGGVVIKDEHSSEECPGQAETLWGDTKPGYPRGDGEYEFVYTWEQYLKRQPALEKILEQIRKPFVQTDSPRRLIALAGGRQVKFAAVINDELIPTTLPGKYRQHHALPVKATVTFDQPYVVYDLQKEGESVKANRLDLSFNRSEARLFALVREPFEELKTEINTNVQAGQALRLKISVTDRAGTVISDPLPFELSVIEPSGKEQGRFLRTLSADETFEFRTALNAPVGKWHLTVHELISGLKATASWQLAGSPEQRALSRQLPAVVVQDASAIRTFIRAKPRVRVLLEAGQEQSRTMADKIAAAFRQRGRESDVRAVQPDDIHVVPLRWRRTERDQKIWSAMERGEAIGYRFGLRTYFDPKQQVDYVLPNSGYRDPGPQHLVFDHTVLIGLPGRNRFLEEAQKLAPRRVTRFYPGQGRGIVQHVWSPFWARKHAVTLAAFNETGLEAAVSHFLKMMKSADRDEPSPSDRAMPSEQKVTFTSKQVMA
ncbi:MAG: hypothetical protein QF886_14915, partial [Planctomycetota bacterium]|nr:hypothetical protein [Planctomycetota bacterium]